MDALRAAISAKLHEKLAIDTYDLLEQRYQRFRVIGGDFQ